MNDTTPSGGTDKKGGPTGTSILQEVVIAVLSLSIAGLALYFLYDTYIVSKSLMMDAPDRPATLLKEAFGRQKDILLLALGLLGTVTGYYLGRIPAERQADAAREETKMARKSEMGLRGAVQTILKDVPGPSARAEAVGNDGDLYQRLLRAITDGS